jgi:tetratricopeptide (TPR) repeat protein
MRHPLSPEGSARERIIRRVLTGLMIVLVAGGLGWGAGQWLRARPPLGEAIELADAGRLDEAEAKLRARLAVDPDDGAAALLLAEVALKRLDSPTTLAGRPPEDWAQRALDQLHRVRPSNRRMAATREVGRGRALYRLLRFVEAEAAWLEALWLDPIVPEAGWHLLNLYYLQGRPEEARRLALRLHEVEPDPQDRVRLLVELLRPDARPPAPDSIAILLEPVVRKHPDDLHSALALGLARTRASQIEAGINQLRQVVRIHPDRVEAWDGLLTALDESGHVDLLVDELGRLPAAFAESPRMWKHRARVAQVSNRRKEAAEFYRRAHAAEASYRPLEYRLSQALRHVGAIAEAERIERRARLRDDAIRDIRSLFEQANTTSDLGTRAHPELYQKIAEVRERMQLLDEARAWHRLVLRDDPEETVSRAALKRLGEASDPR